MIDFRLFVINLLCIVGASFIIFAILTYFKIADANKSGLAIFIGCIAVLVLYCWINVPKLSCDICAKTYPYVTNVEHMTAYNNDTPFFVTDQDGLILPENIHGTMRTDINLDKFLKYGYLSKQLREALMYQKMYGGTNPPPSVTATSQIVSPFGDVVIAVDPVLLATTIPYGAPEKVNSAAMTSSVAQVAKEIATTATDSMTVPATTMADLTTSTPAITTTVDTPVGTIDDSAYNMPAGTIESFDTNATKILLFFSPHCGYCADFMKQNGIWQRVKESVTPYVDIVEVNSDVNPQLCREFNVSYFPCLMKIKNNNVYEFTDARTFVNVKNFIMH